MIYIMLGAILYLAGIVTGQVMGIYITNKRIDGLFEHMKQLKQHVKELHKFTK